MCRIGVGAILESNTKWICGETPPLSPRRHLHRCGCCRCESWRFFFGVSQRGCRGSTPGHDACCRGLCVYMRARTGSRVLLSRYSLHHSLLTRACFPHTSMRGIMSSNATPSLRRSCRGLPPTSPRKKPFAQTPGSSPAPKIPSALQPRMAAVDWPSAYQSWP